MRIRDELNLQELIDEEYLVELEGERDEVREKAKENILKLQEENKKNYDKKRKAEQEYKLGELVAIKRTQFGTGMKLRPKFLGPYKIVEKQSKGRYRVEKVGEGEGPNKTISVAENMKKWVIRGE